jgi:hypothetical protein
MSRLVGLIFAVTWIQQKIDRNLTQACLAFIDTERAYRNVRQSETFFLFYLNVLHTVHFINYIIL